MNGGPQQLLQQAIALHREGKLPEAEALYLQVVGQAPADFVAHNMLGVVRCQRGKVKQALSAFKAALAIAPYSVDALVNLGKAHKDLGQFSKALVALDRALALQPDRVDALNDRGIALAGLGRHDDALQSYAKAISLSPLFADAIYNRGVALIALGDVESALAAFDHVLQIRPNLAQALHNRASILGKLHRHEDALACYERLFQLHPGFASARTAYAATLFRLDRLDAALTAFQAAVASDPNDAEALFGLASVLIRQSRRGEARASLESALRANPNLPLARGLLLALSLETCNWRDYPEQVHAIARRVRAHERCVEPAIFLLVSDSPSDQRACAICNAQEKGPTKPLPELPAGGYRHDKIRVAYLSSDFHGEANSLATTLLTLHDRTIFEALVVNLGAPQEATAATSQAGDDYCIDASHWSLRHLAEVLRSREIDIIVDLTGYADTTTIELAELRPAPIWVSYNNYPGTSGSNHIDYLLADRAAIPLPDALCYSEAIVHLPGPHRVQPMLRGLGNEPASRLSAGLPEGGVVYCGFTAAAKISPMMFDLWMRILKGTERSVLWLASDEFETMSNLRSEAARRGVAPDRLVFAPRVEPHRSLGRYNLADVYLDTLPHNSDTDVIGALSAGLPVLTCLGKSTQGRVTASWLTAIGLSDLIAETPDAYVELAIKFASDSELAASLRRRLMANDPAAVLSDFPRACRSIEGALRLIWGRAQRGEPPTGFTYSVE